MNLKNIFFSYSRTDASDFALKLAVDLQKEGFNVWIDQEDIRAGSEWDLEIEKALETCDGLLFIESEKSVISNNVLDEVYYALEQHKIVIPVIYKDSKTPYRISRLQHIDFTKGYDTGLTNLIHELKGTSPVEFTQPVNESEVKQSSKSFLRNSPALLLVLLLLIAAAIIIYLIKDKQEPNKMQDIVTKQTDSVTVNQDTVKEEPTINAKNLSPETEEVKEKKIKVRNGSIPEIKKSVGIIPVDKTPADKIVNLHETFVGKWQLSGVEPTPKSYSGYLNIEEIDDKKVKILSSFQFYFFKKNDTAFFSVFNGFASCASCILKNEMPITDNDVAFATQTYKTLKENQPGVGNAGDTILNAGANSSIRASVILQLVNKNTVVIKVQKPVPTPISRGFIVEPFVYTFRFTKREY